MGVGKEEKNALTMKKEKMSLRYAYSQSTGVYIWSNIDVIRHKWLIGVLAFGELFFVCPIWILAFIGLIPTVRELWLYGAIYYVVFAPIWIVNLSMSDSRSKELFFFAGMANLFVCAVTSFVLALECYGLWACWKGSIPIQCRDNQFWDIVVLGWTIILWVITVILVGAYAGVVGRIRQSNSIKGIRLRRAAPAMPGSTY